MKKFLYGLAIFIATSCSLAFLHVNTARAGYWDDYNAAVADFTVSATHGQTLASAITDAKNTSIADGFWNSSDFQVVYSAAVAARSAWGPDKLTAQSWLDSAKTAFEDADLCYNMGNTAKGDFYVGYGETCLATSWSYIYGGGDSDGGDMSTHANDMYNYLYVSGPNGYPSIQNWLDRYN